MFNKQTRDFQEIKYCHSAQQRLSGVERILECAFHWIEASSNAQFLLQNITLFAN